MFDYVFSFPSQLAAEDDLIIGPYFINGLWRGDVCIPNISVTVNESGGMITVTNEDGSTSTQPGPDLSFDNNWRLAIALVNRDANLETSPNIEIIANRDLANAGANTETYIVSSIIPVNILSTLSVSPQFAGAHYIYD